MALPRRRVQLQVTHNDGEKFLDHLRYFHTAIHIADSRFLKNYA